MSGDLAVVVLGIVMSSERIMIIQKLNSFYTAKIILDFTFNIVLVFGLNFISIVTNKRI